MTCGPREFRNRLSPLRDLLRVPWAELLDALSSGQAWEAFLREVARREASRRADWRCSVELTATGANITCRARHRRLGVEAEYRGHANLVDGVYTVCVYGLGCARLECQGCPPPMLRERLAALARSIAETDLAGRIYSELEGRLGGGGGA